MDIRAIAFDIDGTLTTDEKRISPRTREAIMRAQAAGVRVLLASGRPAHGLKALARELELDRHHGLLVSFNGGCVVDASTDEVVFEQPMEVADVAAVLEHVSRFDVIPMVTHGRELLVDDAYRCMIEHRGEPKNIIEYEARACNLLVREVGDLRRAITGPENKILTAGTDTYLQGHWREMAAPFADRLSCVFTADFYFEYTARGIDKGASLARVLPRIGVEPGELAAFGDGQNDVTMLELAGVGVAMGNAVAEAKAAANMVCADNNHDGIAEALTRLLG